MQLHWPPEAARRKSGPCGAGREGEEGHAFWRVGVFLFRLPAVINVVSTSLQLNALERKPSASCCLTKCCKRQVRNQEKRGKGGKDVKLLGEVRDAVSSSLFPRDVEEKAHPGGQLVFKSCRTQNIISLCEKDIAEIQQNRHQRERS